MIRLWLTGLARSRRAKFAGSAAGIALAVMVSASLGAFFSAAKAHMTSRAVRGVPVDWQVQLAPGAADAPALRTISSAGGVAATAEVGYAVATGFRSVGTGSVQTTGPGRALGLPPGYPARFPGEIRPLLGTTGGVMLAQQTAANLHASVGDLISIGRPGLPNAEVHVEGIVDLPFADSLFQTIGSGPGATATAPPDNVVLLPLDAWHGLFDPVARVRPDAVSAQVHVKLAPDLSPDPGVAFGDVLARAKNLEARLAGAGRMGDNLAVQLDAARTDAVYAQLLFLFLGLPAVVVAGILTAIVNATGRARRRRDYALLRIRGASPHVILRVAAAEAAAVGLLGAGAGIAAAAAIGRAAFGTSRFGATTGQAVTWLVSSGALGVALALAAILLPARRDARAIAVSSERVHEAEARPAWARAYLDVILLGAGSLVYWQAVRSGYQVVLAPEGVPTISIGYMTLLAPFFIWLGSALLVWRIASSVLRRGRRVVRSMVRALAGELAGVVAASMTRQRAVLSRALVIAALAASFAVSTGVFNATYAAQSHIDAQLTNGADVSVTVPAASDLPPGLASRVRAVPGVADAEPMQHRLAYVGSDLQDLYGIDPSGLGRATPLSDAFFAGGSARRALVTLALRPDGVLVSDETVKDFQLRLGDLVRLRLQSGPDHSYRVVAFHYVGIVREFPTAPHDSFLVANASYVARATSLPGAQTLLVRTTSSPPAVARRIRALLGPASGVAVQDIDSQLRATLSSLAAVDLTGLTRLELGVALALAVAASGLVLALGFIERRRTFAIASALGAKSRQLASFVWSEAAFVTVGGLALGALSGWVLAFVIVRILTGVFDPPPEHLFVPWPYLSGVAVAVLSAVVLASAGAVRATRRSSVQVIRDL